MPAAAQHDLRVHKSSKHGLADYILDPRLDPAAWRYASFELCDGSSKPSLVLHAILKAIQHLAFSVAVLQRTRDID